jgi:hypothetical protein
MNVMRYEYRRGGGFIKGQFVKKKEISNPV